MQSYPLGKLHPNVYFIQVHAIFLPNCIHTKPDFDQINGSLKRSVLYIQEIYTNGHARVPFAIRILQFYNYPNVP